MDLIDQFNYIHYLSPLTQRRLCHGPVRLMLKTISFLQRVIYMNGTQQCDHDHTPQHHLQ